MTTAIIGTGNAGSAVARDVVHGGVAAAGQIEGPNGDLSQSSLDGALLDIDRARAALAERVTA